MGPNGNENFKTLLLQIIAKSFQICPEFYSKLSSQNRVGDLWNFEILKNDFNDFIPKCQNAVPYGELKILSCLENEQS